MHRLNREEKTHVIAALLYVALALILVVMVSVLAESGRAADTGSEHATGSHAAHAERAGVPTGGVDTTP